MYKIIALDLDDTLLNKKKEISEKNYQALKECEALGIKIVIATGRPFNGTKEVLEKLKLFNTDTYVICFNGGLIYSLKDNKVIYKAMLEGKDIKAIYQDSLLKKINFHAFRENQSLITPKLSEYTLYEAKINNITANICDINTISDDDLFIKCMCIDNESILSPLVDYFVEKYQKQYAVFRSAPFFLEFLNKKATKGNALKYLADYLNVDIKDTMSFGDSENDLSMILAAGLGVAMENSYPHIKKNADFVTLACEEDGVSYAINKFILKK